jgi:hypothetical protein
MTMTKQETSDSGVKVVGATTSDQDSPDQVQSTAAGPPRRSRRRRGGGARGDRPVPTRRAFRLVSLLAAVGVAGTLVFGILFATEGSGGLVQDPAVLSASTAFLNDFFNFNAKTVDSNFNAITAMATGAFSDQAQQFFNSSIRNALEQALAESRGQIRFDEVQSENQAAGTASVYAVVDQTYVNNKFTTPQADVFRLIADLKRVNGAWKISDVTVLEGANPASAGTASGSSGSNVPGQ